MRFPRTSGKKAPRRACEAFPHGNGGSDLDRRLSASLQRRNAYKKRRWNNPFPKSQSADGKEQP